MDDIDKMNLPPKVAQSLMSDMHRAKGVYGETDEEIEKMFKIPKPLLPPLEDLARYNDK